MGRLLAGRYRVLRRIGGGGMGSVFEAEDTALERRVAVKLLAGVDTGDRGFLREARALSRLRHPGIVRLYDAGTDSGDAFLVLELVGGTTLRDLMARGPMPAADVTRVGRELAEALAHAHSLGVVHRDLSPGNVLIDESGRVRLADFGIARLSEATATIGGEVWGTPAYMAPEQVAGDQVGPPADVYALGLVLLEALTGERAFPGSPTEAGFARLHRDPQVPDSLPAGWAPLLRAMTARRPADRPYAVSVASRLGAPREVLRALAMPVRAGNAGTVGAAGVASSPPPLHNTRALTTPAHLARASARSRNRSGAAVTGLLLVAAALIGLALRTDRPSLPEALATMSPAAVQTVTAPPPPAPDDAEKHEVDADEGRGGKGKGKDKKD